MASATLVFSLPASAAQQDLPAPPNSGNLYADEVLVLPNGNVLVVDETYRAPGATSAGAIYLLDGGTLAVISTLTGLLTTDGLYNGAIDVLSNGNFVISSRDWNGSRGAVTWGSATAGFIGGGTVTISAANSLVGSTADDRVGRDDLTLLSNGNYVVSSSSWAGAVVDGGAVTWGNGASGTVGTVSAANSLVGLTAGDQVGIVTPLPNGNYVVASGNWSAPGGLAKVGAVTWCNGSTSGPRRVGQVSAGNSLVGTTLGDQVGEIITSLSNGNYVVQSPQWNGAAVNVGAVTWGNGLGGLVGAVSATNSLIGTTAEDQVGTATALTNGNYVVMSPSWNSAAADVGAATWGNGLGGTVGQVSSLNSLVGSTASDGGGDSFVTALNNGNYVVSKPRWDGSAVNVGAVTWGDGLGGTVGVVSAGNSLVGSTANDQVGGSITPLTHGNYVVGSFTWDGAAVNVGAATWGNGQGGTVGTVSGANSLVGSSAGDEVADSITPLANGNYVVGSSFWNGAAVSVGAATWANGAGGTVGTVSAANSLTGSTADDQVGSVTPLTNGNYVVSAPLWDGTAVDVGAATWGNGLGGTIGMVSAGNSLVGTTVGDGGLDTVTALSNGNYVVSKPAWDGAAMDVGATTWASGSTSGPRRVGAISAGNSLVGTVANDGIGNMIYRLSNGDYLLTSGAPSSPSGVSSGASAAVVTYADGITGSTVGPAVNANSVVSTGAGSLGNLGFGGLRLAALGQGNYDLSFKDTSNFDPTRSRLFIGRGSSKILSILTPVPLAPDPAFSPNRPPLISRLPSGAVSIASSGIPSRIYGVQRSLNLVIWTQIGTPTAAGNGAISLTDPTPPQPRAFYRLVFPAQ